MHQPLIQTMSTNCAGEEMRVTGESGARSGTVTDKCLETYIGSCEIGGLEECVGLMNDDSYRDRIGLSALVLASAARAQPPGSASAVPGPAPTFADLDYAPPEPATSNGHKLDLYIPSGPGRTMPVVIWTGGSAWMADTGKRTAAGVAAQLLPAGYAVAGVSIRSSSQVQFPGQLHDIKAAIRWLRANAAKYNLDPNRIGIMGDSSGGWTTAMAAVTGDVPEWKEPSERRVVSSKVQAAVAFYPPTKFLTMDAWAVRKCVQPRCHDDATSPESRLVGCAIRRALRKCRPRIRLRYVTAWIRR